MGDSIGNYENWRAMVEDGKYSDDEVIIAVDLAAVDLTDGVITNILVYLFDLSSAYSNLSPGITTAYLS